MRSVVTDEDFHGVIHHNTVGKLQEAGATELVEDVANHVEDDDPHDLALHHDDPSTIVGGHTPRMLQDVRSKLADELSILGENLDLRKY